MTALETFAWGFAGSVAVEVVAVLGFYDSSGARLPARYRRPGFWITRFVLAVLAGALAVGYGVEQRILAFNIGAATPLIIMSLARGLRPRAPDPRTRAPARPESSPDGAAPRVCR